MAYFEFDNRKVYYKVCGKGTPLLLLHGNTASSCMFNGLIESYAEYFQVITIDFPGHGQSERMKKFEIDFWYYNSKACYKLIKLLKLDKLSLIGTSGGALVAINLALEHPECFHYIVADSFEGEFPLTSYMDSLEAEREVGKKDASTQLFWKHNHGSDWEDIVDADTKMLLEFTRHGKSFFHRSISELKVPTLLTGSKEDEYCPYLEDIYSDLQKKNPLLRINLFKKGNHPAMLSNDIAFFELLKKAIINT
ncbi:alpha/beta fold hydrolase [Carboxylicivirga sp. RSCT41]|uniref:alpha/beta fold hydrolase n=1 Tax=Carboxylicivirga agarovorans TaxID=3417570 RepID=UPI003D32B90A